MRDNHNLIIAFLLGSNSTFAAQLCPFWHPGLHLLHLLLHLCHDPLSLLVDHHQLLQLPLSLLLLQFPIFSAPFGGLVVEVSHPPELLGGRLVLSEVGSCRGGRGVGRRRMQS